MAEPSVLQAQTMIGRVALVTGASSGIGAATAVELSNRGANVIIHYRSEAEKTDALATQSRLNKSFRSIIVEADLQVPGGPAMLVQAVVAHFQKLDYLFNNAAAFAPPGILPDMQITNFELVVGVNARGPLLLTQEAIKCFTQKDCRIVNITSTNAMDPVFDTMLYAGSKAMLDSFTRSWAKELRSKYGCTVNTIAPGPIATENLLRAPPKFLEQAQKEAEGTPVEPRLGKPEEVGWAIATLCEPRASWINGVRINVNGGLTLW